jgi:NADH:ubiquinone reductase (H+-translocating)
MSRQKQKTPLRELEFLPHIVIVGGGFAGLATARGLAGHGVRVTLVDKNNFHTFLPLLYQVATAGLEPADVAYPIRTIFGNVPNVDYRHGSVREVRHAENQVVLEDGSVLHYDHLVIATGATASYFGIPGASQFAMPLYTLADARGLRNRLLLSLEEAEVQSSTTPVSMNFVVVGGGPTGVETAGALSELMHLAIKRDGLRLDPENLHVILVDRVERVLMPFPLRASAYAERHLKSIGVELQFGRVVVEVTDHSIRFEDGDEIETAAVIWCAGVTAAGTLASAVGQEHGPGSRVLVESDLRLVGSSNVWAIGDSAAIPEGEGFLPQLAPVAIQSGRKCATNILAVVNGQPTTPMRYRNKGIMATIGRRAAVAKVPGFGVIRGTLGWLAWLGLHLWYLVGSRNKIRVFINWTWRYFDWPSGPRVIVSDVEKRA